MTDNKSTRWLWWQFDPILLLTVSSLLLLGLVMVTSASMVVAETRMGSPFYYAYHHAVYLALGLGLAFIASQISMSVWQKISAPLFFTVLVMLTLVLLPGIGKTVNGSSRWINFGFMSFQVSEIAKLVMIVFMARFIVRHEEEITTKLTGFLKPLVLLGFVGALLLMEPDFGAMLVIVVTGIAMLFLAGVPLKYFTVLVMMMMVGLAGLMVSAPYRVKRLTSFLDPWAYQYDSGYQLTQALIAFGRGEWLGVGLGSSVQKLFYLPEAYTDFVFAVLAEELGLLGAVSVVSLFIVLIYRGIKIGMMAEKREDRFSGFVAYGLTFWLGLQALINMGVNTGLLPTKGLTLPFLSYGGSSLLVVCTALGLLFRVDRDNRLYYRREAGFANYIKK